MIVTLRDLEMFQFLLEQYFASGVQLGRRFWKDIAIQTAYRRFKILEKEGFIELVKMDNDYAGVYMLTKDGYRVLRKKGMCNGLDFYSYIDSRTFNHDLSLNGIRIIFYELGIKNWLSERRLRSKSYNSHGWVSDAVLLHRNNTKIALELEFTRKKKARYARIFGDYDRARDIDAVFYLVGCQDLKTSLIHLARDFPRIFFCLYDEFIAKQEKTIFESKDERFVLKEML